MRPSRAILGLAATVLALGAMTGCAEASDPASSSVAVAVVSSPEQITTIAEAAAYADALTASAPDALDQISRTAGVLSELAGQELAYAISLPMKARLVVIQTTARQPGADPATLLEELRDRAHRAAAGDG